MTASIPQYPPAPALPASLLAHIDQRKIYGWREYRDGRGVRCRIRAEVRYGDGCRNNGHNTLSITGEVEEVRDGAWKWSAGGCLHDEIAQRFANIPELLVFDRWPVPLHQSQQEPT